MFQKEIQSGIVAHNLMTMSGMKNIAKWFGYIVAKIQDPLNVFHYNVSSFTPILDCKITDIQIMRLICRRSVVVNYL